MSRTSLLHRIAADLNQWNYVYLLLALLVLLCLEPMFENISGSRLIFTLINSVIIIAGVWGVHRNRRQLWVVLSLGIPSVLLSWFDHLQFFTVPTTALVVIWFLFFATLAANILRNIIGQSEVGANLIFGVLSVYIIIGLLFALVYGFLELHSPGSFNGLSFEGVVEGNMTGGFMYYSFVTLTTLGYGDITPLHPVARSLTVFEAMIGVMYMAVMVARFVSMYRSPVRNNPNR